MQPQGSIFHSGFLGEVQFKFDLKKWTFVQTSEVVFTIQGKPQKVDFKETDTVYNLTWFSFAISQKEDSYRFYFVPHVCQKVPYFFKIFQLQKTIF